MSVRVRRILCFLVVPTLALSVAAASRGSTSGGTIVRFETDLGDWDVQLFDDAMPNTVQNFLNYVTSERYDGTTIHRNADSPDGSDFVIQGGGFSFDPKTEPDGTIVRVDVETDPPIDDEPGGGVAGPSNQRGTIAMAKSGRNTVTSQWFVNQKDNSMLDDPDRGDGGFSAFGVVLNGGMAVVDAIGDLPLPTDFGFSISSPFAELPLQNFEGDAIQDIELENTVTVRSVSVLSVTPGNFNLDDRVSTADRVLWRNNYGTAADAFWDQGDADRNGMVDSADILAWQRNWGGLPSGGPVTAVPEPAAWVLAASTIASLALAARLRPVRRA